MPAARPPGRRTEEPIDSSGSTKLAAWESRRLRLLGAMASVSVLLPNAMAVLPPFFSRGSRYVGGYLSTAGLPNSMSVQS